MDRKIVSPKGEIEIYKAKNKGIRLEVRLDHDTVWLTQAQIAGLFGTKRPAITKHLLNIFKDRELQEKSVCSILEHTAKDGKNYATKFYNLDVIISVGYRVNSHRATQFRIWATEILRKHLIDGYTFNEQRLQHQRYKLESLQKAIRIMQDVKVHKELEYKDRDIIIALVVNLINKDN